MSLAHGPLALTLILGVTGTAVALGPEWVEDDDAGNTNDTAQPTKGSGPLTSIRGRLDDVETPPLGPGGDLQDAYLIKIDHPGEFMVWIDVEQTHFEGSLYLLREQIFNGFDGSGSDGDNGNGYGGGYGGGDNGDGENGKVPGKGLLGNIDPLNQGGAAGEGGGGFFNGAAIGNMSTDGTGIVISQPGLYLLVIAAEPTQPFSAAGPIYSFTSPGEVSGPDGPGGSLPLQDWFDLGAPPMPAVGPEYVLNLSGVTFAIETGACCFTDGTCIDDLGNDECAAMLGIWQGGGVDCAGAGCAAGPAIGSASDKGSLLVFPKIELRWDASGAIIQDAFVDIANDFPEDVEVLMYFVNGDAPTFSEPGWNWVDVQLELTKNEPTYWSALTGLPKGVSPFTVLDPGAPPGRPANDGTGDSVLRGYILAWAVDPVSGTEIRWNHLKGEVVIQNYREAAAWEYNAYGFPVVDDSVANGDELGSPGLLRLTGTEYAAAPAYLLLDFYAAGSAAFSGEEDGQGIVMQTDLTLLPVSADLRQETDGPVCTKAHFDIWNMNEIKFSGTFRCVCCWDQTLLSSYGVPNHFLVENLQTEKGRARIDGLVSQLCLGGPTLPQSAALLGVVAKHLMFETGEVARSGTNLHGLGAQGAFIRYDPTGPPPKGAQPAANPPARQGVGR